MDPKKEAVAEGVKKYSPAEPVTDLKRIRIVDNGEPLVDFLQLCPELRLDEPRFDYRRETVLRQGVAERLCHAAKSLPSGYRLAIVEGWRPPFIQRRMYQTVWARFKERNPDWSDHQLKRVVNRFSAPMDERVPPPHTTGAALDVWLVDDKGIHKDLISPYEPYDPKGFAFDAPGLSDETRRNRAILKEALEGAGITNYPSEYWHYSYGDQGWAYRGGHPHAIYAAVTPADWTPDPRDEVDAPLEFLER